MELTRQHLSKIGETGTLMISDEGGAVALIFALTLLPLTLAVGGAMDYSRATVTRGAIQKALDAGVLSAVKSGRAEPSFLKNYLNADLGPRGVTVTDVTLSAVVSPDGGRHYVGDARFAIQTNFLKLVAMNSISVSAHSEATLPGQVLTVTFTPTNTQGAFAKDIFLWTRDASGAVTSRQTVLTYRYSTSLGGSSTPPIGTQSISFSVPPYTTYGLGMVAYQDLSYTGGLVNPREMWSDGVAAADFLHQTGACSATGGATFNWEDGGDGNFIDFVYNMTCTLGASSSASARLTK